MVGCGKSIGGPGKQIGRAKEIALVGQAVADDIDGAEWAGFSRQGRDEKREQDDTKNESSNDGHGISQGDCIKFCCSYMAMILGLYFVRRLCSFLSFWGGDGVPGQPGAVARTHDVGVVRSERTIKGKTSQEERLYIGSIPVQAKRLAHAVRAHWEVENRLHWCLDVCVNDDQARARVKNSAQNLACIRRMVLNIPQLDKSRKGGIKARRMIASTGDRYREQLLGLKPAAV